MPIFKVVIESSGDRELQFVATQIKSYIIRPGRYKLKVSISDLAGRGSVASENLFITN